MVRHENAAHAAPAVLIGVGSDDRRGCVAIDEVASGRGAVALEFAVAIDDAVRGEGNGHVVFAERLIPADGGLIAVEQIAHLTRGQSLVGRFRRLAVGGREFASGIVVAFIGIHIRGGDKAVDELSTASRPAHQAGVAGLGFGRDDAAECAVLHCGRVFHVAEEAAARSIAFFAGIAHGGLHYHVLDECVAVGASAEASHVVVSLRHGAAFHYQVLDGRPVHFGKEACASRRTVFDGDGEGVLLSVERAVERFVAHADIALRVLRVVDVSRQPGVGRLIAVDNHRKPIQVRGAADVVEALVVGKKGVACFPRQLALVCVQREGVDLPVGVFGVPLIVRFGE